MKMRAVVIFDYDFNHFTEAAEEHKRLQKLLDDSARDNPAVLFHDMDMKERRRDKHIPMKDLKLSNR